MKFFFFVFQPDFLEYIVEDLVEQNVKYTSREDRYG